MGDWTFGAGLTQITEIYDGFERVSSLAGSNSQARGVLISWSNAEWFIGAGGILHDPFKSFTGGCPYIDGEASGKARLWAAPSSRMDRVMKSSERVGLLSLARLGPGCGTWL